MNSEVAANLPVGKKDIPWPYRWLEKTKKKKRERQHQQKQKSQNPPCICYIFKVVIYMTTRTHL